MRLDSNILNAIACTTGVDTHDIYIDIYEDEIALAREEHIFTDRELRMLEDLR